MDVGAGDHTLTREAIVADVVGRVVQALAARTLLETGGAGADYYPGAAAKPASDGTATGDKGLQAADGKLVHLDDGDGVAEKNAESTGATPVPQASGHKTAAGPRTITQRLLGGSSPTPKTRSKVQSSSKAADKGPVGVQDPNKEYAVDESRTATCNREFEGSLREQLRQEYQSHRAQWLADKRREIAAGHSTFSASCLASPDCSPIPSPSSASERPAERTHTLDSPKALPNKEQDAVDNTLVSVKTSTGKEDNAATSFLALNKKINALQEYLNDFETFLVILFSTADPNCGFVEREGAANSDGEAIARELDDALAEANNTSSANSEEDRAPYNNKAARVLGEALGFEVSPNKAARVLGESLGMGISSRKAARVLGEGIGMGITTSEASSVVVVDEALDMEVVSSSTDGSVVVEDGQKNREKKAKCKKGKESRPKFIPGHEIEIPKDGSLRDFSADDMSTFLRHLGVDERIVSHVHKKGLDGKRFSKLKDSEMEALSMNNPVICHFRDRSGKKSSGGGKKKLPFML